MTFKCNLCGDSCRITIRHLEKKHKDVMANIIEEGKELQSFKLIRAKIDSYFDHE